MKLRRWKRRNEILMGVSDNVLKKNQRERRRECVCTNAGYSKKGERNENI